MADITFTYDEIQHIIGQAEYELLDGVGMQYHVRTFTRDEYETIKGTTDYVERMVDLFKARKERKA